MQEICATRQGNNLGISHDNFLDMTMGQVERTLAQASEFWKSCQT
jgi:hypothetical protein